MTQQKTKQLPKNWKIKPLSDYLDYEQPNPYIITTPIIKNKTPIPVLTANKCFIKGYTDETEGIYKNVPVIIFDDFTTDNKFVNFPFKVKSSAMKILKQKGEDVDLRFIFYQMQMQKVNHTTHKRYYLSTYQNLDFVFPPLPLQQKIVSAIKTQFTRLDEAVKSLKVVKQKIQLYRKAVLKKAFEKKEGWEEKTFGKCVNNFDGKRIPLSRIIRSKRKGAYPYYGATKIIDYVDDYIFDGKYLLIGEDGANLLSMVKPLSFIVSGKFWVNNHAHVVQTKEFLNLKYLEYYFNSKPINKFVSGTAQPKLNQTNLNKIKISFPSLPTQQQIVSQIESSFSVIDKVEEAVDNSLKKAEQLRKSILKVAFEGRLVK